MSVPYTFYHDCLHLLEHNSCLICLDIVEVVLVMGSSLLMHFGTLPETGDFMREIVLRESDKHTHENNRFHEGDVNPATKTYFHESAPHTVMKISCFRGSI